MDLLENGTLDYVEFRSLDLHWKGYVKSWIYEADSVTIYVTVKSPTYGEQEFRLRIENSVYRDRDLLVLKGLVDQGYLGATWESWSIPIETPISFFLTKKRWGYWVAIPVAIFLYFNK